MRAHEVSFLDLVQGEKQFQVPLYQRTYSWGGKQLAQLWRDLLAQSEAMADGAPAGTHFMGSVVITPSPTLQAAGVNRWLLVDGQQRLTTLMLALAAIRDHVGGGVRLTGSTGSTWSTSSARAMTTCGCFPLRLTGTRTER